MDEKEAIIVDTNGCGFFLLRPGNDGKYYNFYGKKPMNPVQLEKAKENSGFSKFRTVKTHDDLLELGYILW